MNYRLVAKYYLRDSDGSCGNYVAQSHYAMEHHPNELEEHDNSKPQNEEQAQWFKL